MNREDTVSLVRELMVACPSFVTASSVSIFQEKDVWALSVMWTPDTFDGNCLEKIVADRDLQVVTSDGRTIFRSQQK
jgi:hypothetical protein